MKRITNARSLSVNTGEMNNQINHTGMAARTRSQRLNRGLTLLVVGALALLLAGCADDSAGGNSVTVLAKPDAPTIMATSDTVLDISWSALSYATQYRLYRSATEDGTYERIATDESIATISYTNSGLTAATTYYYRVAACSGNTDASCSAQSATASGITRALPVPTALSVVTTSDTVLFISWSVVSGATQYRLYRSVTEGGTYERLAADASIAAAFYIDRGLAMGTTYYYRIAACIGNTDSSCSAQSAVASGIAMIPSVPTALTVTATSDIALTISWGAVSGATQYRLYRSAMEDGTYTRIRVTGDISYINSGLTAAGTTYYYQVAACGSSADSSCSAQSVAASGITRPFPAPTAPSVATASGTVALTISWSMVSGATQYRLYRSAMEDGTYERIAADESITAITYIDSGLTATAIYYYRLATCNGNTDASCSAQSTAANGVTNPPIPAAPTVTATSDTVLTIEWDFASGATQYRLYRSATENGTYERIAADESIATITYTNSGLTARTTYYYRVAACAAGADSSCSAQSAAASASTIALPTPDRPTIRVSRRTTIALQWSAVSGATRYRLYRSTTNDGTYTRISSGTLITATSRTDFGLTSGTVYHYRLAACISAADSSCSAQSRTLSSATGSPRVPDAPTVTAASNTALLISWRAVDGITQYRLERSTAAAGTYTRIATITSDISYVDTGRTPETAYYYRLTACGNSADSSCSTTPSLVASATTPAAFTTVSGAFASAVYNPSHGNFGIGGPGQPSITHGLVVIGNRLYMMANTSGLPFNAPQLYELHGGSSAAVPVGVVGPSSGHELSPQGMAAIGNTVYMVGSGKLYSMEIDPNTNRLTAFATIVGTLQHGTSPIVVENEPRGLAAIGNTLYLVGGSTPALYTVSTTNGSLLKVGDLKAGATFLPSDRLTSAMTANNSTLYMALKSNAVTDKAELYSINPTDAQATLIGDITTSGASPEKTPTGLAVWGERLYLLGADQTNLHR